MDFGLWVTNVSNTLANYNKKSETLEKEAKYFLTISGNPCLVECVLIFSFETIL